MRTAQLHGDAPVVTQISELILPEEADHLIRIAEGIGLKRSTVEGSGGSLRSEERTSDTAFIPKSHDPIVECIEKRIATVAQQPHSHLEPLQVTRYGVGQKYSAHHDYFVHNGSKPQRTTTVFTYLKGLEDGEACGGETAFPKLGLSVSPVSGNAVMWSNRQPGGAVEPQTLHAGRPVTCEEHTKIGLNAWFQDTRWR